MSNKITEWAYEALVIYGGMGLSGDPIEEREELKKKSLKEICEIFTRVNRIMEQDVKDGKLKPENLRIIFLERIGNEWILYRYPEKHESGEKYRFV